MNYDVGTIVVDDDAGNRGPYHAGETAALIYRGVYENLPQDISHEERKKIALELTFSILEEMFR
jgi:hypothetical protein